MTEITLKLKRLAEGKGMTLREVSKACGLGVNALYQVENLTARSLVAVADFFECSVDYILGRGRYLNGVETELLLDRINSGMPLRDLIAIYGSEIIADIELFRDFAAEMAEEEKALDR